MQFLFTLLSWICAANYFDNLKHSVIILQINLLQIQIFLSLITLFFLQYIVQLRVTQQENLSKKRVN